MEDIGSQSVSRLSVLTGTGRAVSVKLLSQFRLEQKLFDSDLKVITEEFILCFITAWDRTVTPVYSNLAMHPCTLLANFKGFLWKTPPPLHPSHPPTSITNYHTKVSQHTTLHYTESLHRRSSAGWLKLSSPEFPRLAYVIKVDEGRRLARRAQKWSSAWGSLCSVHGERLFCLVPFTLQNMYCLQFMHWMPRLSLSYFLLVAVLSIMSNFNGV